MREIHQVCTDLSILELAHYNGSPRTVGGYLRAHGVDLRGLEIGEVDPTEGIVNVAIFVPAVEVASLLKVPAVTVAVDIDALIEGKTPSL